jgi:hypothetical protein
MYTYALNGTTYTGSAALTFGVQGPTGVAVNAPTGTVNIWLQNPPPPIMQFGGILPPFGIEFDASATPPPGNVGAFSWVQLVDSEQYEEIDHSGRWRCIPESFASDPKHSPELDTRYPADTGLSTNDNPAISLDSTIGEMSRTLSATMYLMWTPNADSLCTSGSACTIPVPLGYVNWNFCGDSINTLAQQSNSTTWILNRQSETPSPAPFDASAPSPQNNYSYPTWKTTLQKDYAPSCTLF